VLLVKPASNIPEGKLALRCFVSPSLAVIDRTGPDTKVFCATIARLRQTH
jgi:hypothetical protein